jgi:hypothetical protein
MWKTSEIKVWPFALPAAIMVRKSSSLSYLMVRTAIIAALLCTATLNLAGQSNRDPGKNEQPSGIQRQTTEAPTAKTETPNTSPPHWYTSLQQPEWWLVVVGILTFFAIWYQSMETARAAKAMQTSVALQEAALRQWVVIEDWLVPVPNFFGMEENTLEIGFTIANPTKMPLVLEEVTVSVGDHNYAFKHRYSLTPDNRHHMKFYPVLQPAQSNHYLQSGLVFTVSGVIVFTDALGKRREQPFRQMCKCGPGRAEFTAA